MAAVIVKEGGEGVKGAVGQGAEALGQRAW